MNASPYAITILNAFTATAFPIPVTVWNVPPDPNAQPPIAGTPEDVTGWKFMFTMKKSLDDSDAAALYKDDTQIGGTNGQVTWTIPSTITASMEAKFNYYWDVRIIVPGKPGPNQLLRGTIFLEQSVGQRTVPSS
jgi:hypothetical protein